METSAIRKGQTYAVRVYGGRTGQTYEATVVECLGKLSGITYGTTTGLRAMVKEKYGRPLGGIRTREGGYHFVVRNGASYYVVTSRHFVRPWAEEQRRLEQYQKVREDLKSDQVANREQAEAQIATLEALGIEGAGFAYYHGVPCLWLALDSVETLLGAVLEAVQ